ncbi:ferrous iron transporter A [Borrelia hispanica]|uniref:ferrous iron transporter A n=1 Tax=Borrelia hispanica TaxID=40835 RepID=UPI000462F4B6|nr:ferrous iron transporter A [Borrelia hispanica]
MKFKTRYLSLGLLFSFISCDLIFDDKIKEKSLVLFDKVNSILDTGGQSVENVKSTKQRRRIVKKRSSTNGKKSGSSNLAQDVLSGDIISGLQDDVKRDNVHVQKGLVLKDSLEEIDVLLNEKDRNVILSNTTSEFSKEEIQKQKHQDVESKNSITEISTGYNLDSQKMTYGELTSLRGESGELKETIESNAIEVNFTIDSDLGPKHISGPNTIAYTDTIEEEDYDQYYWEDDEESLEDKELLKEEIRLDNRYKSYLESVRYNVDSAIDTIDKIYNNYLLFNTKQTQMYSTRLNSVTKAKAKEEAKYFTKEKLERDLKTLLNYIQVSAKTATNFVYIKEIHAKQRLDKLETEMKSLISKVQGQSRSYEAYKSIVSSILQMKDSLKIVQSSTDKNGPWY